MAAVGLHKDLPDVHAVVAYFLSGALFDSSVAVPHRCFPTPKTSALCCIMSVTLHTNVGDIKIEVFCESVPKTAENFLALCASGYYNGSLFHRLIPTFMIQTGAPPSQPKGGSSIWEEPFEDEIRPTLRHNTRGIVSMANKGPATNGSQFFICFDTAPHLDGKNTVFGHVLGDDSMTVLSKMEEVEVDKKNKPKQELRIESVTIHANPLAG